MKERPSAMPVRPFRSLLPVVAGLTLALAACSSSASTKTSTTSSPTSAPVTAPPIAGSLNVFAAASLTGAFNNAKPTLVAANPGLNLTLNYAGSNALVAQIIQGAPADVFASADTKNMPKLGDAGLGDPPANFGTRKLELA